MECIIWEYVVVHISFQKILYLKRNPDLCEIYGQNARTFAEEHFRIDKIADRFETILSNPYE